MFHILNCNCKYGARAGIQIVDPSVYNSSRLLCHLSYCATLTKAELSFANVCSFDRDVLNRTRPAKTGFKIAVKLLSLCLVLKLVTSQISRLVQNIITSTMETVKLLYQEFEGLVWSAETYENNKFY